VEILFSNDEGILATVGLRDERRATKIATRDHITSGVV
jgi:hypothetical protein